MSIHGEDEDIYRGDPLPPHLDPAPSISSHSSSSESSSESFLGGGRIGAIAAKLEVAISRWAKNVRGNSSETSSSSSSSSSRSSVITLTKSQLARRRRRSSVSSLRTMQSERDIAARITRMKALQESRQIPREFALYLPPSILPASQHPPGAESGTDLETRKALRDRRITSTTSLPLVLNQLDNAMRKSGRYRRVRQRNRGAGNATARNPSPSFHTLIPINTSPTPARRGRKGKHREQGHMKSTTIPEEPQAKAQAWFLDVANPTWADLRAIGKLLHIHPLTLEDILQQDPREKLELFTRLGYYFISFRAIESQATREKIQRDAGLMDTSGSKFGLDEGSIGEANVYLTVFNDGICCFHYTDISEHTDRVRNRIVLLEEVVNMSSDWIAHGILDSVVDSFFPFLEEIEKEVMAIDHIVYDGNSCLILPAGPPVELLQASSPIRDFEPPLKAHKFASSEATSVSRLNEKFTPAEKLRESYRPRFASPRLTIPLLYRRAKRHISSLWKPYWSRGETPPSATHLTLRRMARTRKLVTVLGRLLATKSDVVTQIRKRLMRTTVSGGNEVNSQTAEELEISIYMGDVQDHILTLQHSLAHYERMLSQSHPTYLSQLRSTFEMTKGGTDMNLLYLTMVSISVLCLQTLTGAFSLNINVPHNRREPDGLYVVFGVVLALASMIISIFLSVVRYWWKKSKRRRGPL